MDVVRDFCSKTSIHGLSYIVGEFRILQRIFWAVVSFVMIGIGIVFFTDGCKEFFTSQMTSINTTTAPLKDLYFPSIYVCNINQVSMAKLAQMGLYAKSNDNQKQKDMTADLFWNYVKGNTTIYKENITQNVDFSLFENLMAKIGWNQDTTFLDVASQKPKDALLRVTWKDYPPKYYFQSFLSLTDYGACGLIIPNLDFENELTKDMTDRQYSGKLLSIPHNGVRNGVKNGLEIFADAEVFDYAYFFRDSSGFMIGMAKNNDKAIINQRGFYVRPGTTNSISMTANIMKATDTVISRLSPDLRTCYTESEFEFMYLTNENGYRYSIDNCLYEAVLGKVLEECKCIPFFVTVKINVSLPKCR